MYLWLRRNSRVIAVLGLIASFFLLLILFRQARPVAAIFNGARAVMVQAGAFIGTSLEHIFYSRTELERRNQELSASVESLAIDQVAFDEAKRRLIELEMLLGYTRRSPIKPIAARVISRAAAGEADAALIDRGSEDGAAVSDPVVARDGFFVGVITAVYPYTSVVRLLTDGESRTGSRLMNAEGTIGIIEGQGGVLLRLSFIPQSVAIEIDDLVATSGLDASIPSGLPIGLVAEVIVDEHDPFQSALIRPLVDTQRLTDVAILPTHAL